MSQASVAFSPIGAEEKVFRSFNFAPGLSNGETISGSPTVTITVLSGIDPTPQSRILNTPVVSGAIVTFLIGTMVANTVYQIMVTVTTSETQVLGLYTTQQCLSL